MGKEMGKWRVLKIEEVRLIEIGVEGEGWVNSPKLNRYHLYYNVYHSMALNIGFCEYADEYSLVSGDGLFEAVLAVEIFIRKSGYEVALTTIRAYWCWSTLVVVELLSL